MQQAVSVDRAESSTFGDGRNSRAGDLQEVVHLDSRGQPLPRDLNGALLAFNAFLDQNKISAHSPKDASEKSQRFNAGFPDKTLAYQQNLLSVIESTML